MTPEIEAEFQRLRSVITALDLPFSTPPGVEASAIAAVEQRTGIIFDPHLKSCWEFANGSKGDYWFANGDSDSLAHEFTPCYMLSLESAIEFWSMFEPYDEAVYQNWHYDGSWGPRDARIQPTYLRHRLWLPFAEFNGGSRLLQFDADPYAQGKYGQIIAYEHDPDQVDFANDSFLEFFRQSNTILENSVADDADALREFIGR